MRGQGITVDQLSTFQAGKVEKVCYLKDVKGQSLDTLLPRDFTNCVRQLYQLLSACVLLQAVPNLYVQ